jgi:hypothetical protein
MPAALETQPAGVGRANRNADGFCDPHKDLVTHTGSIPHAYRHGNGDNHNDVHENQHARALAHPLTKPCLGVAVFGDRCSGLRVHAIPRSRKPMFTRASYFKRERVLRSCLRSATLFNTGSHAVDDWGDTIGACTGAFRIKSEQEQLPIYDRGFRPASCRVLFLSTRLFLCRCPFLASHRYPASLVAAFAMCSGVRLQYMRSRQRYSGNCAALI